MVKLSWAQLSRSSHRTDWGWAKL